MRFFASWWERFPVRSAVPTLVGLFVVGVVHHIGLPALAGAAGFFWG